MRSFTLFLLALAPAAAQEVKWLGDRTGLRIARDEQGAWFTVEPVTRAADNRDLRIRKLTPDLSRELWVRTVGGSNNEDVTAIRPHAGGLLLLGNTWSKDLPVSANAFSPAPPPGLAGSFLWKLSATGDLEHSTYLSEAAGTELLEVANGEIVLGLSGRLWRMDLGATRRTGEVVSRWIGGAMKLHADKLWIAGTAYGDDLPVSPGAFQTTRQSGSCFTIVGPTPCGTGFAMRLDIRTGAVEAATYLGGTAPLVMAGIAIAPDGAPIVAGTVLGGLLEGDFPTTPGAFQPAVKSRGIASWFGVRFGSWSTPFVARLSASLDTLVYATYLAGSRAERVTWLSTDEQGRAIVGGDTLSRDFPATGAFSKPCGPDRGPNVPSSSFVARLSPDGSALDSGAILPEVSARGHYAGGGGHVFAATGAGIAAVSLDVSDRAVVACTVNGASYRPEDFIAPGQLLTLFGAGIAPDARLLFDNIPAELLYIASDQINAVVPRAIRGQEHVEVVLESDGVRTHVRNFAVYETNPTVKVYVRPDGTLEDRGNPQADVRLADGARNSLANPARRGETVEIYATGLDLTQPLQVYLPDHLRAPAETGAAEDPGSGVQKIRVRIPAVANGGVVTIAIENGNRRSAPNAGFVWVE